MRDTSTRRRQSSRIKYPWQGRGPSTATPPPLRDGDMRCDVCRNRVRVTSSGVLRGHRDLFGWPCYNRECPR